MIALEVDRSRVALVAVDRAAGHARDLLVVYRGDAVEDHGRPAPNERDVVGLPVRPEGRLRGRACHAVNAARKSEGVLKARSSGRPGAVMRRIRRGYLRFIAPPEIDPAVLVGRDVEFDVQLEIAERPRSPEVGP